MNYEQSIHEITRILGVHKFKSNGFSARNIKCLFHNDRQPSASLHREKGLYCHSCGQWYTWKAMAGKLGVEWHTAKKSKQVHTYLTDEVIQKFLVHKRIRACQVLSELYRLGYENKVLNVKEIIAVTGCSNSVVARMTKESLFFPSLPTSYNIQEEGKRGNNSKRGRKQRFLRVPTLSELETLLDCDDSKRFYTLEVSEDVAELKAEVIALPVKRAKDQTAQLPRMYLGRAAGVKSPKTVRKYMKMVSDIEKDEDEGLLTVAEFDVMPETQKEYEQTRKNGRKHLRVRKMRFGYNKEQALVAITLAGSLEGVTVVTQRANIYHYTGVKKMSEEVKEFIRILQSALILRKLQTQKSEWERLMDDLDNTIQVQQEQERQWELTHPQNWFQLPIMEKAKFAKIES